MASRIAARYIPLRFSSNASRNLFMEGKAICHSIPSINQITSKPSSTINDWLHQSGPNSDQFSRQEFNHLVKRVNRLEERDDGIDKSMIRDVEQSERIDKTSKSVEERVQEVQGEVMDIDSELTYLERKIEDFHSHSNYLDVIVNQCEEKMCRIEDSMKQGIRKVEEILKDVDQGRIDKIIKEVLKEPIEGVERRINGIEKHLDESRIDYSLDVEAIFDEIKHNRHVDPSIHENLRQVVERMDQVEQRVKEFETLVKEVQVIGGFKRQVDDVEQETNNIEERIEARLGQIEERMVDRIMNKVEERMKQIVQPEEPIDKTTADAHYWNIVHTKRRLSDSAILGVKERLCGNTRRED